MKLTVLGKYGPFPHPGGACSSYLIEAPRYAGKNGTDDPKVRIVLDLGAGALSRLLMLADLGDIDAVLLSHLHSDHISDMPVLRYALQQLNAHGIHVPLPLSVVAPSEPNAEFRVLAGAGTFNMVRAEDKMKLRFGALTVTLHAMLHTIPSFAMDIFEDENRSYPVYGKDLPLKRIVYTGDTGMHLGLETLFQGASLVLADTGLMEKDHARVSAHMTAEEAALLARNAGVGKLLLTHIWGGGADESKLVKRARQHFDNAEVAQEMESYTV
ncbi:MAG: MBL fold metallo-hydrolase [Clostridiales bacterium]|jgi:ribonuclease BN (tRNA processing enzyme)|nr:MBL fold metallo-hydrolase [Clostridiales bacterium]